MTNTKYLQLPIPSKSDRGKIITECLDPAFTKIDQKIETIDGNIDFNLLATLGIPYGGILNNSNPKVAGTAYYDTANKKIYKCTSNTSINYADAGYFIEISNNDLLGKLQNLIKITNNTIEINSKIVKYTGYVYSGFTNVTVTFSVTDVKSVRSVKVTPVTSRIDVCSPVTVRAWDKRSFIAQLPTIIENPDNTTPRLAKAEDMAFFWEVEAEV